MRAGVCVSRHHPLYQRCECCQQGGRGRRRKSNQAPTAPPSHPVITVRLSYSASELRLSPASHSSVRLLTVSWLRGKKGEYIPIGALLIILPLPFLVFLLPAPGLTVLICWSSQRPQVHTPPGAPPAAPPCPLFRPHRLPLFLLRLHWRCHCAIVNVPAVCIS